MDAKITKKRLAHMLSYDWVKVIGAIAAGIVVWALVFTMTATRITNTQRFVVCNYLNTYVGTQKMQGRFSHEILEAEFVDNMRGGDSMFNELFSSNVAIGEGDVLMVANYPTSRTAKVDDNGQEIKDGDGNLVYEYSEDTYMSNALQSYFSNFSRLDDEGAQKGYFTQMKEYLAKFYTVTGEQTVTFGEATFTTASFDKTSLKEDLVETEFRARIKANKDKRYKTEAQIVAALEKEIDRIESYLTEYEKFFAYAQAGYISFTYLSVDITETYSAHGVYGINLCPNEQTMGSLKEQFYYTNLDGTLIAKDINAVFMSMDGLDPDYQYENISFINALIESVCTELQ